MLSGVFLGLYEKLTRKFSKSGLLAGLRQDTLGELTTLSRPSSRIKGAALRRRMEGGEGRKMRELRKERERGEGKEGAGDPSKKNPGHGSG